ncbi:TPA: hypothetical protein ACH3X1_016808 [Trebouxia sp. C0004]
MCTACSTTAQCNSCMYVPCIMQAKAEGEAGAGLTQTHRQTGVLAMYQDQLHRQDPLPVYVYQYQPPQYTNTAFSAIDLNSNAPNPRARQDLESPAADYSCPCGHWFIKHMISLMLAYIQFTVTFYMPHVHSSEQSVESVESMLMCAGLVHRCNGMDTLRLLCTCPKGLPRCMQLRKLAV